jgi:hypothetical protein
MDKTEARTILAEHLSSYRVLAYADLVKLVGTNSVVEVLGPSGTEYQIEIDVGWGSPRDRGVDVLVMGAIDDGRLPGAISPLSDSFIMTPDGKLVGE